MAFTNLEKIRIRTFLGYASRGDEVWTWLENAIVAMESDSDKEDEIRGYLGQLGALQTSMLAVPTMLLAIKSVDKADLVFQDSKGEHPVTASFISAGERIIGQMSLIMNVPIRGKYFGRQGCPGEAVQKL